MGTTRITTPQPLRRRLFAPVLLAAALALLAGLFALSPQPADANGPQRPGPVASLLLEAETDSVTASWQAPESGGAPDRYIVHLKPEDGGKGKIRRPKANKTRVTFRNLESGATYRVSVRGQNAGGKGQRTHASITLPEPKTDPEPEPQQQEPPKTFSVTPAISVPEGSTYGGNCCVLKITLSEAAPQGGLPFTVKTGYDGDSTATADDVGDMKSSGYVTEGLDHVYVYVVTVDDDVDEDDETFTVTIATAASGWGKAGDGQDTTTVTITDNDTAGVSSWCFMASTCTNAPLAGTIKEDKSTFFLTVLESKPTANVTITVSSSDAGAARVTLPYVNPDTNQYVWTVTPDAWAVGRVHAVIGVADADTDNETVSVSFSVASDDPKYDGIAVTSATVKVEDTTPDPD